MKFSSKRNRPHKKFKQPKWKVLGKRRSREHKKTFILEALGNQCWWPGCPEKNPLLLHFHHPNHDRRYQAGLTTKSWAFIRDEVKKGALLCEVHNGRDGALVQHGKPGLEVEPKPQILVSNPITHE